MIPVCEPLLDGNERKYVEQCLDTNWVSSGGPFTERFEKEFATYCGCKYGITTSNGTTALHLALVALGVGPGDEVLVPDLTIASCAFAVLYTGATPVFVDSEPDTFNMDAEKAAAAITPRTRAIMPVHLYGRPANMDDLMRLAYRNDLRVIEDAAEAHGATHKGRRVGGIGHVGCFSFYSNKLISAGEGGMVVTNSERVDEKARRLKDLNHSPGRRFYHEGVGFNYRLGELQAALGVAQLETLDKHIEMRRMNAALYAELLDGVPGITVPVETRHYVSSVSWMFCILAENERRRNELMIHLGDKGVQTRTFFVPMHKQPMFLDDDAKFPVATDLGNRGMYLPSGTGLKEKQIRYVCDCVREWATR